MSISQKLNASTSRSAGVLLLVGVIAGVTVGGAVGVIAASPSKSVTVCANKTTNVLRYAKNGKCTVTETKLELNNTGSNGTNGTTGVAGAKGDTGVAGAKGDAGAVGVQGAAGTNGTNGTNGTAGAQGSAGVAGTNGTNGVNGAAGASSPTGFTARSVCGASGTTLCAVGVQGPGGGTILYVDTTNEMPGYDYLEVAPTDATFGSSAETGLWSATTAKCGPAANTDCQTSLLSDAGIALGYIGMGTGRAATAAIVARHDAGSIAKNVYGAGVADDYTTATASDWWLPSKVELNEVCKYARQQATGNTATACSSGGTLRRGVGGFDSGFYWSSSEYDADFASSNYFIGYASSTRKTSMSFVRPVRAF